MYTTLTRKIVILSGHSEHLLDSILIHFNKLMEGYQTES